VKRIKKQALVGSSKIILDTLKIVSKYYLPFTKGESSGKIAARAPEHRIGNKKGSNKEK